MDIAVVVVGALVAVLLLVALVGMIIAALSRRAPQSPSGRSVPPVRFAPGGETGSPITVTADALERIRALLQEGKKITAIKELRMVTGLGLKEAKDMVEAMEVGRPVPLAVDGPGGSLAGRARALRDGGEFSRAVVLVRGETGMSETEAQAFVTSLAEPDGKDSF